MSFRSIKSQRRRRLLASANDPGAAFQIIPIVRKLQELHSMEVTLIAGGAAISIFRDQGLAFEPFDCSRIASKNMEGAVHLMATAEALIKRVQPDGLLVGLSGLGCGLDEALLAAAPAIPTFAMQDYWGDVNPGFGVLPSTYFVMDKYAAKLTARRAPNSAIVIAGSPRHQAKPKNSTDVLRMIYRDQLKFIKTDNVVTFIGQPLWHLTGYRRTLELVAQSVAECIPNANVIYRLHPLETSMHWEEIQACFSMAGLVVAQDPSARIEDTLCGADILLSCYSNASLDGAVLTTTSQKPLAAFVFVLIDSEISDFYKKSTGLKIPPLAHLGLAAKVNNVSNLNQTLLMCMTDSQRLRFQNNAKIYFENSLNSIECISEHLNININ